MTLKRVLLAVGVVVSACCISSCGSKNERPPAEEGDRENGIHRTRYPSDTVAREVPYKNGKVDGVVKDFFPNGKLFESSTYVQGVKHGPSTKFYESGVLSQETVYDSGKIDGVQKKYRKDGKLAYEMYYDHDCPCTGLKEYGINGDLKMIYPAIRVDPADEIQKRGKYTLFISMSDDSKNVSFFIGKLENGTCLVEEDMEVISSEKGSGVGILEYDVEAGISIVKELNIIAKVKTVQGNYYLTQKTYKLAIANR